MRWLGAAGATGLGALQACPGWGKGQAWPGVLSPRCDDCTLQGTLRALKIVRGRPSPFHQGLAFPGACSMPGLSPTAGSGRGGVGRDTTGPHRAPGSQGPAELEQLGQEGGTSLVYSSSEGPWPPGWPIKPTCCPINRQQPCAVAQLRCPRMPGLRPEQLP